MNLLYKIILFSLFVSEANAATTHPGGPTGAIQYNNSGYFGGFSNITVGGIGGIVTPAFNAANGLYQLTQALEIDPRYYGAACDAQYFDGRNGSGTLTTTANSTTVSIAGYTFTTADVGKTLCMNGGTVGGNNQDMGIPCPTVTAIGTGGSTATVSQAPLLSTTVGYAILAHDDTLAFYNSAFYTAQYHGSYVVVPDNCAVRHLFPPSNTTYKGQSVATGYGFAGAGRVDIKPTLNILESGYASDTYTLGIEITGLSGLAFKDLEIRGMTYPYFGFTPPPVMACIGTAGGNAGYNGALALENVTISYCPVGLGVPHGTTPGGYIFGKSTNSEFASNGDGMSGNFSDWNSMGDTFTGNFYSGATIGPVGTSPGPGGASRFVAARFEENGTGFVCDTCYLTHFEGSEFQFNNGYGIELSNQWKEISMTGGFMQGNGLSLATGHQAMIGLNGTSGAGHFHLSNVSFDQHNYAAGGTTPYIIDGITSGANNADIEIDGGTISNGYSTAIANWEVSAPTIFNINVSDNVTVTTVSGSSSGNAKFSQPVQQAFYKRVIVYCNALNGTASYTFPMAFTNTPVVLSTNGLATTLVTSLSTTAATVTGSTSTGYLIIEGY